MNLAKVIFMLKHSVKLRRYVLCGCVAVCHGMTCVFYAVQRAEHTTHTAADRCHEAPIGSSVGTL